MNIKLINFTKPKPLYNTHFIRSGRCTHYHVFRIKNKILYISHFEKPREEKLSFRLLHVFNIDLNILLLI